MSELARPFLAGLGMAHFNLGLQLSDLTNEDAIRRARGDSGSSISWIVGHLLSFRSMALNACGVEHTYAHDDKFAVPAAASDGSDYPDISELHSDWNALHDQLTAAVGGLDAAKLNANSGLPGPFSEQSTLEALSFVLFHEAYHMGVLGMLRVQWGYRHTHELALEAGGV